GGGAAARMCGADGRDVRFSVFGRPAAAVDDDRDRVRSPAARHPELAELLGAGSVGNPRVGGGGREGEDLRVRDALPGATARGSGQSAHGEDGGQRGSSHGGSEGPLVYRASV